MLEFNIPKDNFALTAELMLNSDEIALGSKKLKIAIFKDCVIVLKDSEYRNGIGQFTGQTDDKVYDSFVEMCAELGIGLNIHRWVTSTKEPLSKYTEGDKFKTVNVSNEQLMKYEKDINVAKNLINDIQININKLKENLSECSKIGNIL